MSEQGNNGLHEPFELPNGKKVRIKKLTVGVQEEANKGAAIYAAELLRENKLPVKKEVQNIASRQENIDVEMSARMNQLARQIQDLELQYKKVSDPDQQMQILDKIHSINYSLFDYMNGSYGIYDITVEAHVDRRRQQLLKQLSILENETGNLYWPTLADMENDEDIESYNVITLRFSEVLNGSQLNEEQRELIEKMLNTLSEAGETNANNSS